MECHGLSCNSELTIRFDVPPLARTLTTVKYVESRVENLHFNAVILYTLDSGEFLTDDVSGVYNGVSNIRYNVSFDNIAKWNESTKSWIKPNTEQRKYVYP